MMPRKKKKQSPRQHVTSCHLGVLHAFGPGYLHAPNRMLEFKGSKDRRMKILLRDLKLVCLYGPVRVTAGAIRLITDAGAALAYLSVNGARTNGILQPSTDEWKGRRYRQYRAMQNPAWSFEQARNIVRQKTAGQTEAAAHYRRQGKRSASTNQLARESKTLQTRIASASNYAQLRGMEGYASRMWFESFRDLLPEPWNFPGRRKRPPTDPINALLSLGYTILFHRVEAACQSWGLDTALGCFHEYRPGRASLACDLMEPFRVSVVDRLLLTTLARNQFSEADFVQHPKDFSVQLTEDACKRWLNALETQLHQPWGEHPPLHLQLTNYVQQYAQSLPPWDGTYPSVVPVEDQLEDLDSNQTVAS